MATFKMIPTLTFAAAFGTIVMVGALSLGGSAEAASVFSCKAGTAAEVTDCCEKIVAEKGRPYWMVQSGATCHSAIVCWKKSKSCGVKAAYAQRELNDKQGDKVK
jgi:hypothetical protein